MSVTGAVSNGWVHITVADNGAGFDQVRAARLFEPFQRLHPVTDYPGNGVGLALVQRIVHRHGGEVTAEGVPGRGARFSFTLRATAAVGHTGAAVAKLGTAGGVSSVRADPPRQRDGSRNGFADLG